MRFLRHYVIGLVCLAMGFLVLWQPLPTQAQGAVPATGKPALYEFGAVLSEFRCSNNLSKSLPTIST